MTAPWDETEKPRDDTPPWEKTKPTDDRTIVLGNRSIIAKSPEEHLADFLGIPAIGYGAGSNRIIDLNSMAQQWAEKLSKMPHDQMMDYLATIKSRSIHMHELVTAHLGIGDF